MKKEEIDKILNDSLKNVQNNVKTISQDLVESKKKVARKNIGAVSIKDGIIIDSENNPINPNTTAGQVTVTYEDIETNVQDALIIAGQAIKTEHERATRAEKEISDLLGTVEDTADDLTAFGKIAKSYENSKKYTDDQINNLDSSVNHSTEHIQIEISQENGELSGISIEETDIASAEHLQKVENLLNETIEDAKSYSVRQLTEEEITALKDVNIKEAYTLIDEDNTKVGAVIKVYKDSSLQKVELATEKPEEDGTITKGQFLKFTYYLKTGELSEVYLDVSLFLVQSEFKNGFSVNSSGEVSVLIDNTSDSYLSLSENGIKISGITDAINAEINRAKSVEQQLDKNKADKEGYYDKMSVGVADNLTGRGEAIEREFVFEQSAGVTTSILDEDTARIESIQGNTLVWNQGINNTVGENGWQILNSAESINIDGSKIIVTLDKIRVGSNGNGIAQSVKIVANHKYFIRFNYDMHGLNDGLNTLSLRFSETFSSGDNIYISSLNSGEYKNIYIPEKDYNYIVLLPRQNGTTELPTEYVEYDNVRLYDLTKMFGVGNEPTTADEAEKIINQLNVPKGYNAGQIINNNTTAIKTVGFNILNTNGEILRASSSTPTKAKTWAKEGNIYLGVASSGYTSNITDPSSPQYSSVVKNADNSLTITNGTALYGLGIFCKVLPNTKYTSLQISQSIAGGLRVSASYYDENKIYISSNNVNNGTFTTPSNAAYVFMVYTVVGGGTATLTNPCVHLTNTGYRNGEYEPYREFTRELPTVEGGLKSAGTVYDELRYNHLTNKWEYIKRVGEVDLGGLTWQRENANINIFGAGITDLAIAPDKPSRRDGITASKYAISSIYELNNQMSDNSFLRSYQRIYFRCTSCTTAAEVRNAMQGVTLYYELAEPIITELDTDVSPDYDVEDWGTEEAIQVAPSAPFKAMIKYGFNAVDQIRGNKLNIDNLSNNVSQIQSNIETLNNNVKTLDDNIANIKYITKTTYSELVSLRDNSQLIPGTWYRITDYVTTTSQAYTQSAGHQFDVIVLATDVDTLSEEAKTCLHEEDTYFSNSNLNAWKIWYCLDNDISRFAWADSENGTGVIYRMIDEWNNDCPYDFKNIQFNRNVTNEGVLTGEENGRVTIKSELLESDGETFKTQVDTIHNVVMDNDGDFYTPSDENRKFLITRMSYEYDPVLNTENLALFAIDYHEGDDINELVEDDNDYLCYRGRTTIEGKEYDLWQEIIIDSNDVTKPYNVYVTTDVITIFEGKYLYTFSWIDLDGEFGDVNSIYDFSIKGNNGDLKTDEGEISGCYGNEIGNYHIEFAESDKIQYGLNDNVFLSKFSKYEQPGTYNNVLYIDCIGNSFGDYCYDNSFGNECNRNSFGNECYSNTFGNYCYSNTFGDYCYDNSFGNGIGRNSFGNECLSNNFGNDCYDNSFGNECNRNSFGNYCEGNSLGSYCNNNIFGNECYSNSLGSYCHDNSFGNECYSNNFGESCFNISFGNGCYDNSFGNGCEGNSFGNYCFENAFGNYCSYTSFENNCFGNSFGNSCNNNSFGNSCNNNSFEGFCEGNTFGNHCYNNSFGEYCAYNSFGNGCNYNSFEGFCEGNSFGNKCRDNSFESGCSTNTFGNECSNNSFGNSCGSNSFGNGCTHNSFGNVCNNNSFGDDCYFNSFRMNASNTGTLRDYCYNNIFENGVSYVVLYNNSTSSNLYTLQNVTVCQGMSGTSSSYNIVEIPELNAAYQIKVTKNSSGAIKVYCEADLIQ